MQHLPRIYCATIPHKKQRYDTEGDYFPDIFGWNFTISKMDGSLIELIILIHELWEWYRTQEKGIKAENIDKFDKESGLEDPGLSPKAPYHKEHMESVRIEKLLCRLAGITYKKYYNSKHL